MNVPGLKYLPGLRTWSLGIKSMALHPLRAALTVLGIFVGVASVIWLLALGEGISAKAQEQIASLGALNIIVQTIKPNMESIGWDRDQVSYGITRDDRDRIVATIPTIEHVLPIRLLRRQFRYAHRRLDGRLVGCTPEYADVNHLFIHRGRFITDADMMGEKNYCVLAAEAAAALFPVEDPIGMSLSVENDVYVIVGVLESRAPSAAIGGSFVAQDFSKDVYIPISTLWRRIGDFVITSRSGTWEMEIVELSQLTLRVDKVENVMATSEVVKQSIEPYHDNKDYGITIPLELLEQARTTRLMFMVFMGLIAAISLVVGGIGIMNIMLATVTERTREIGIRRALGAKRRDITQQFLVETIVMSVGGGICGMLGGLLCRPVFSLVRTGLEQFAPDMMANLPDVVRTMVPVIVPWSYPLAFAISVAVGLVFGVYPAIRAARLDPIEALRHE